jgi:tetratricopeptide (TPR) repeat protein
MAIVAYQKALQLQSNNNRLLTGLATTYAKQNLLSVGIPLLEEVARIEPSAKHFNNLGYAYYLNQQYTEANRVLTQAITLDPGYVQAQKNLALVSKIQPVAVVAQGQTSASTQANVEPEELVVNKVIEPSNAVSPSIEPQAANIVVQEIKTETKMVQTASSVYELSLDPQLNSVAKTEPVISANVQTPPLNIANDKPKNILAAISGGISFKHAPVMNKLFDFASNSIASFNVSDNDKFVEIINGNGIKGIAKAVASKFKESGNLQLKVADAKRFNQMKTHIQYKSVHRDDAVNLNRNLLNKPYLIRNDNLPNDVALRLVLGRDLIQGASVSAMIEEDADSGLAS